MPTFENGWICRECWSANREQDQRCYRCHAVPKRRDMPEPITFSTPDGRPNEERKKVSSLTAARPAEPRPAAPPTPTLPATPLSERIRGLVFVRWARAGIAAIVRAVASIVAFGRAVVHAPGNAVRLVSRGVSGARNRATAGARGALAHRRMWLSVAWGISGFSCALLFSVALGAPLAASLLVVASVAIFSGLTSAIMTSSSERRGQRSTDRRDEDVATPAEILGSRPVH
jgi:hypothetical protein